MKLGSIGLALLLASSAVAQTPVDPPPPPVQRSSVYLTRDDTGMTTAEIVLYLHLADRYCSMAGTGRAGDAGIALSKAVLDIERWHRIARAEIDAVRQQVLGEPPP
jgi:hypothetical protein